MWDFQYFNQTRGKDVENKDIPEALMERRKEQ